MTTVARDRTWPHHVIRTDARRDHVTRFLEGLCMVHDKPFLKIMIWSRPYKRDLSIGTCARILRPLFQNDPLSYRGSNVGGSNVGGSNVALK